ncbi:alpha-glucosidase [Acholeplasma hippikon]|uniref:Oligo-1,6-glucosidase n=1 Tax=Acholeplasma hippikon TaxID=264636 RepID=A0A449BJ69_9MOLU|nr:alpha-glucosidase [Acholeplasma hippikon]VEU82443.1 Oligo-1,6-glucosidase [Acholeplasma hippikon]
MKVANWKDAVIYQIYPRSFKDSNDDGIGDIPGIISKLDYLKSLGVDIIWLSPVYDSPNDDNGYDICDYQSIHKDFGTMEDMENLINEAKNRGIGIIMDLVINHTSDEHPWFIQSKDKTSPYRDYYIWQDKPNNWTSFFGGKAWSKVDDSYYLHLFSKKQPDLNLKNLKVIEEIKNIMHFWLKKGIMGFRCDVINVIYKTSLANGKKRLVLTGLEHYHSQKGCHDILKELRKDVMDLYPNAFTVGETVLVNTKQANELILPENKELNMVFGFQHMETDQINNKWFKTKFKPKKFMKTIFKWQEEVFWNANYLENHDQPRSVSRFGDDKKYHSESAKMLAVLNLTLKGTPYIYEGQEIGMTNAYFDSLEDYQDVESKNIYQLAKKLGFPKWLRYRLLRTASRDNARQPVQWDATFGFTKGMSWLKENPNKRYINVLDNLKNEDSILNFYKELIKLRKSSDILKKGDFKRVYLSKHVFVYERLFEAKKLTIILNMSKKIHRYPFEIDGKKILGNYKEENNKLRPYEAVIISNE